MDSTGARPTAAARVRAFVSKIRRPSAPAELSAAEVGARTWDLWEQWSAPIETVAQVARASRWALRDVGVPDPTCRIDVYSEGDVESFASPSELLEEVTNDAIRKCDGVVICVGGENETILAKITLAIRGDKVALVFETGVVLELTAYTAEGKTDLPVVRDRIRAAIERRRYTSERISGEGGAPPRDAYAALTEQYSPAPFPWRRAFVLGAVMGCVVLLFPPARAVFAPVVSLAVDPDADILVTAKTPSPLELNALDFISEAPALAFGLVMATTVFAVMMGYSTYALERDAPPHVHAVPAVRVYTNRIVPLWRQAGKLLVPAMISLFVGLVGAYLATRLGLKK
jgi:hypothetical protein